MREEELAELENLSAAATPGPWTYARPTAGRPHFVVADVVSHFIYPATDEITHGTRAVDDAAFIAAARTAVPALVAEVRALRARRDELLATVAKVSRETPYPDELKGWEAQRAAMVAEVGTLRARVEEVAAERDVARALLDEVLKHDVGNYGRWTNGMRTRVKAALDGGRQ